MKSFIICSIILIPFIIAIACSTGQSGSYTGPGSGVPSWVYGDPYQDTILRPWLDKNKNGTLMTENDISKIIKNSIIFFKHQNRCFAAIPYLSFQGSWAVSFTQITCGDDIK